MEDWKRIPKCPDEGMCLQKVIRECRFWDTDGQANFYAIWRLEQQRSTAVDQVPCTLESPILLRLQVLSTVFKNEKWRMVGAFFAGFGSTVCETDVRLRKRQAGYLCLGDSYDLTLQAILSNAGRYSAADPVRNS
jgi:hypothetical protein